VKGDEEGVTLRITNPTMFDASVGIFAETQKQVQQPLGVTAFTN